MSNIIIQNINENKITELKNITIIKFKELFKILKNMDTIESYISLLINTINYFYTTKHQLEFITLNINDTDLKFLAESSLNELNNIEFETYQNVEYYKLICDFYEKNKKTSINTNSVIKVFFEWLIKKFKNSGIKFDNDTRNLILNVEKKISQLKSEFKRNLTNIELKIDKKDLNGVPNYILDTLDFSKSIIIDEYIYNIFMKYINDSEIRKKIYFLYNCRSDKTNTRTLLELSILKHKKANLLGYESHLDYECQFLANKKIKSIEKYINTIYDYFDNLFFEEMKKLVEIKNIRENKIGLKIWDIDFYFKYYEKQLRNNIIKNNDTLNEYFHKNIVNELIFKIVNFLFKIQLDKTIKDPIWDKNIDVYDIKGSNNSIIGKLYIDIYRRPGKSSSDFVKSIIPYCKFYDNKMNCLEEQKFHIYINANFVNSDYFSFDDYKKYFYLFGQFVYIVSCGVPIVVFGNEYTEKDFNLCFPRLFEQFAFNRDILSLLKNKNNKSFPKKYMKYIDIKKNINIGFYYKKIFVNTRFDLCIHKHVDFLEKLKKCYRENISNSITVFKSVYNTLFDEYFISSRIKTKKYKITSEEHIFPPSCNLYFSDIYDAKYFGFLWADVFNHDIYYSYFNDDIFNKEHYSRKLQKKVFSKGAISSSWDLLESFLKKTPSPNPFINSLNVVRGYIEDENYESESIMSIQNNRKLFINK